MSVHRMSPRLPDTSVRDVPLFRGGRAPARGAGILLIFAVLPAFIALIDERAGLRLVMGALVALIVVATAVAYQRSGTMASGVVSIDGRSSSLRFCPPPSTTPVSLLLFVALLAPAAAQGATDALGLPTMNTILLSRAPYVLAAIALVSIGVMLWRLRTPAGLDVTVDGLRGVRGAGVIDWSWDEVGDVAVEPGRVSRLLLTHRGGGRSITIPFLSIGTDPHKAAVLVRFYRDNPADRTHLSRGGIAAVRHVDDVLRERAA